ncbi:MAG: nitroreductase family protein [Thermoleophilia bacterium]
MELPDHWHGAISERHSYRSFIDQPIEPEKLEQLEKTSVDFAPGGARAVIVRSGFDAVSRGIVGAYGSITGAPAYATFIGDTTHPAWRQMCGYLGEGVVLEAVALGLSTCWVGGFFRPGVVAGHVELTGSEKVLAVTPLGYRTGELTRKDRLFKAAARSRKRKPLSEMVSGLPEKDWPDWVRSGLEAARVAPSAVNRQPWRFLVEPDAVTLSVDSGKDDYRIPKRLDCGIAMLHFELGARHADYQGSWKRLELPAVARFTP